MQEGGPPIWLIEESGPPCLPPGPSSHPRTPQGEDKLSWLGEGSRLQRVTQQRTLDVWSPEPPFSGMSQEMGVVGAGLYQAEPISLVSVFPPHEDLSPTQPGLSTPGGHVVLPATAPSTWEP